MIGHCGFNIFDDTEALELVIHLNRDYWEKGYATEAGRACLSYALNTLNTDRIVAMTDNENLPSQKILEKIGMTYIEDRFVKGYMLKYYEMKSPTGN